ncbi:MAG: hypothetical protein K0R92_3561, partial [Lachnospiraceae bacterium]|nr:hypothetical protein [Lachnospiraceae bacterium]
VLSKEKMNKGIFTAINLPGTIPVDCYRIQFYVKDLAGFSYKTYIVKPNSGKLVVTKKTEEELTMDSVLENEYLRVIIYSNGEIYLLDKRSGKQYKDILILEDTEDCGDSYTYKKALEGKTITSKEFTPEITCIRNNSLEKTYVLKYNMQLPECFDKKNMRRSSSLTCNIVKIILKLKKGSKRLDIRFEYENTSKDHRLRALIATGIDSDYTKASIPFDLILRDKKEALNGIQNGTQPNSGFIDIDGEDGGMSLFTEGIYEYEHLLDKTGVIALTLLRANSWISIDTGTGVMNNYRDDTWMVPGNQCIRMIEVAMAIQPHGQSLLESNSMKEARTFHNSVLTYFQPADLKKFSGGRPAVQDTDIKEIFYREDPYGFIQLPMEKKFLSVEGENILLSSVKKANQNDSLVLRLYNAGEEESEAFVSFINQNIKAYRMNMNEEILGEIECENCYIKPFGIKAGEIITVAVMNNAYSPVSV